MEQAKQVLDFMMGPYGKVVVLALLFVLSELIGINPKLKASGVIEAVINGLTFLKDKIYTTKPPQV